MPSNKFTMVLTVNNIELTPVATGLTQLIPNGKQCSISTQFAQKPLTATPEEWMYRYPTLTVITINLNDGNFERIELQDITNQPTWSTGTPLALQTAETALAAWIIP